MRSGSGHAGAGFDLRFNFPRRAKCALREGEGPRTFGFFMSVFQSVGPPSHWRNWRRESSSAKFCRCFRRRSSYGHFIDSLTLPKVLDQIVTRGATFNIVEFKIGQKRVDQSFARIEVTAPSRPELDELIQRLREQGAEVKRPQLGDK